MEDESWIFTFIIFITKRQTEGKIFTVYMLIESSQKGIRLLY